ncbi:MAG TPA: hypothetical protein VM243_10505 [Phycisphaerae bacterium]|nr:hypothetical protein [Phycisphaerae bacterium]
MTLRQDLSAVAYEYADEVARRSFIGQRVAPLFGVAQDEAAYPIISRENFLKPETDARANDGTYNFIDGQFGSGTYKCEEHGLSSLLDDRRKKKYRNFIDFEEADTRMLVHKLLLNHERRVASMVINATTFTAHAPATVWSTSASATPTTDIETGLQTIRQGSGMPPETVSLILSHTDFVEMCKTTDVLNLVSYTFSANQGVRPAILKPMHIATILGIKEVLVGVSAYDTTEEGVAVSASGVWGTGYAMLAVLADSADQPLELPSAFRTMLWTEDSPEFPVMERYYDNDRRGEVLRARLDSDEVLTADANLLTYLLST